MLIRQKNQNDFQRGQIFDVHKAGATLIKMAQMVVVSRRTVSKRMAAYEGKTFSSKQNPERELKLSERDYLTLVEF